MGSGVERSQSVKLRLWSRRLSAELGAAAGPAGMAAAAEARRLGLAVRLFEAAEPFATIAAFPRRKPIFTYPRAMRPAGALQVSAQEG